MLVLQFLGGYKRINLGWVVILFIIIIIIISRKSDKVWQNSHTELKNYYFKRLSRVVQIKICCDAFPSSPNFQFCHWRNRYVIVKGSEKFLIRPNSHQIRWKNPLNLGLCLLIFKNYSSQKFWSAKDRFTVGDVSSTEEFVWKPKWQTRILTP